LRASYEAVVSTPPPTPNAMPLSVGSASSSQLALSQRQRQASVDSEIVSMERMAAQTD
jgi:hypothetical protein